MKANELRIGNYLWEDYSGVMMVSTIANNTLSLKKQGFNTDGAYLYDNIKAIPLTEEWLLKFGFDNRGVKRVNLNTDCECLQVTKEGDVLIYDDKNDFIPLNRIKHVHQLQNLYFALTGEELKLLEQ